MFFMPNVKVTYLHNSTTVSLACPGIKWYFETIQRCFLSFLLRFWWHSSKVFWKVRFVELSSHMRLLITWILQISTPVPATPQSCVAGGLQLNDDYLDELFNWTVNGRDADAVSGFRCIVHMIDRIVEKHGPENGWDNVKRGMMPHMQNLKSCKDAAWVMEVGNSTSAIHITPFSDAQSKWGKRFRPVSENISSNSMKSIHPKSVKSLGQYKHADNQQWTLSTHRMTPSILLVLWNVWSTLVEM